MCFIFVIILASYIVLGFASMSVLFVSYISVLFVVL